MGRSGYSDDIEHWDAIRWRGAVKRAIRGRRGQAFLRDLLAALDMISTPRLIVGELKTERGFCALGVIAESRGLNTDELDPWEHEHLAGLFGIARCLVQEIEFENDETVFYSETPEARWTRMRAWVAEQIKEASGG